MQQPDEAVESSPAAVNGLNAGERWKNYGNQSSKERVYRGKVKTINR